MNLGPGGDDLLEDAHLLLGVEAVVDAAADVVAVGELEDAGEDLLVGLLDGGGVVLRADFDKVEIEVPPVDALVDLLGLLEDRRVAVHDLDPIKELSIK